VAGGTATFTATVTGANSGQSTAVTWSVPAGAGSIGATTGAYVAPAAPGTYVVTATSVADASKKANATVTVITSGGGGSGGAPDADLAFLPADRATKWNPGVLGGIPARTTVCANVSAATYGNGGTDATSAIQAAINGCPAGQVVQLSAGTFRVSTGGGYIQIAKGITLRGAGPGQTILQKTDGAKPNTEATGASPSPIIIVGPARWANPPGFASSTNLSVDGVKGSYSVTLASGSGFAAGQVVLLDELSGAAWQTDPGGRGQVWASSDWRVVWQKHNPGQPTDDPLNLPANAANQDAFMWFSRLDRPTAEVKEIASVSGNTITFTTPIHITYRTANTAQLSRYGADVQHVKSAGVEDLSVIGGDNGQIRFEWAASSWARNVESSVWHDEGFAINNSFRIEIREAYVHDAAWAQPGGAGYAISFAAGSSESLVENSIIVRANKVMVSRSAGAGSVIGYNYVDEGYINTNGAWQEVGLNGSHMVGPHHMLFEGNYGFNYDSDKTHGSAIYHTVFRNHLSGVRHAFVNPHTGATIDDVLQSGNGPQRCAGLGFYSYWHSFVGNVLGRPGLMSGWIYETRFGGGGHGIWMLGWDDWNPYPVDPKVASTTLRDGNFDYVTNTVRWDRAAQTIPNSFYLSAKPAFFGSLTWPWVDPTGTTKLYSLPAKVRFDAMSP
jgi:hypothetical protein